MKVPHFRHVAVVLFSIFWVAPCFAHHKAVVVSKEKGGTALS
jgi:hypothetical protein